MDLRKRQFERVNLIIIDFNPKYFQYHHVHAYAGGMHAFHDTTYNNFAASEVYRVGVGIMSQLSIIALFLEMDYLRILKIAPDIK